jgi:phosphohistidine swiveling domain-containing protein
MTHMRATRTFEPPGPGTWEQDSTHCPRPMTAYAFESFRAAFPKGFSEGSSRYGLLFSHLEPSLVNNFVYYRQAMVDPNDTAEVGRRFEAARTALEQKLWRQDLDRWDKDYKPDSIRRNRALESVPLKGLDTEGLIAHLAAARANATEMIYRHHIFTIPCVIPVGLYLANAAEWTGLDPGLLLAPLKGSSPVSLGALDELRQVGAALAEAGVGAKDYPGLSASDTLTALRQRDDAVGAAVRAYFDAIGMRLVGGYDVADPCAIEMPDMLAGAIWASTNATTSASDAVEAAARVRDAVPDRHRDSFDGILEEVRLTARLRDERGIYNDAWGTGIARQAILEAGRRLAADGRIDEPENAIDATPAEHVSLLRGTGGPPREDLRARTDWRRTAPLNEVPPLLGPPPGPPPPMDGLPAHVAELMRALGAALGEVFTPAPEAPGTTLVGKPVSPGVYSGRARVIRQPEEFNRLEKGDILVAISTSPAFNVVLPLLGGIVTDRGGQLSHAAIVAREYGIPAVVGTLKATSVIPDGARIRVDGGTGRIVVL